MTKWTKEDMIRMQQKDAEKGQTSQATRIAQSTVDKREIK
jgi:hypothetical protein